MSKLKIKIDSYNYIMKQAGILCQSWFAMAYVYVMGTELFGLELPKTLPLVLSLVLMGLYLGLKSWGGTPGRIVGYLCIILPAFSFFFGVHKQWMQLFYQVSDRLSEFGISLGAQSPVILKTDSTLFCGLCISFWLGAFFLNLNRTAPKLVFGVTFFLQILLMVWMDISIPFYGLVLLLCWAISIWVIHLIPELGLCAITLGMFLLATLVLGISGGTMETQIQSCDSKLAELICNFRYHKSDSSLPSGDLSKKMESADADEVALKVTMEKPESLYLRGYVGNLFQDDHWEEGYTFLKSRQAGILTDSDDLLDELVLDGYYSQNQMEHIVRMDEEISDDNYQLTIENVSADSSFIYTTYEMGADFFSLADGNPGVINQGEELLATGFFGKKYYSYHVLNTFPSWKKTWLKNRDSYSDSDGDDSESGYTSVYREQLYQDYVYRCFLTLSQKDRDAIDEDGELDGKNLNAMTTLTAVEWIRNWISDHMKDSDDVQASTKAVLLFRYLGIPSRYVEGYVISREAAAESEGEVDVRQQDGHAWPEIYLDNLGWIPVEVQEEYIDKMNSYLPDSGSSGGDSDTDKDSEESKKKDNSSEANADHNQKSSGAVATTETGSVLTPAGKYGGIPITARMVLMFFVILIGLALLYIVILPFLAWTFFKNRKKALEKLWRNARNHKRCVCLWYRNLECVSSILMGHADVKRGLTNEDNRSRTLADTICALDPDCDRDELDACIALRQKAIYSQNRVTKEERKRVAAFCGEEVKTLEEKLDRKGKFLYTILAGRLRL